MATLLFGLAGSAFADTTRSTLLIPGTASATVNLDTGDRAASGGDILWDGSTITTQGNAKVRNLGMLSIVDYTTKPASYFVEQASSATSGTIPADQVKMGDVFVVVTNAGSTAKVMVGSILTVAGSGPRINLQYTTFSGTAPGTPIISQIMNNSSNIPPGYPNYGIAPSSLFIVTGSFLADPGVPVLQSSAAPGLPLALNGASITVKVNGVTTYPALYYTSPNQLAAVLPAATPIGTGTLTVTYNGATSQPATLTVVPSALGINVYDGNLGVATDAITGALLTFTNSGKPGEIITLWTTGLGADPADSDTTYIASPHSVATPLKIFIGSVEATILYQGSSPYPGVDQINVTIPDSVPTGCWVPLTAVAGGVVSNGVLLPINAGGGSCHDVSSGLTGDQLPISGGQTIRAGLVALIQTNNPASSSTPGLSNAADAAFETYTGFYAPPHVSPGACLLNPPIPPVPQVTGLDAGTISLKGPDGLAVTLDPQGVKGSFYKALGSGDIPSTGGTFTFTGTGGADVGAFATSLTFDNPLFSWTNPGAAATINRQQDFTVTWTGGNSDGLVYIYGGSYSTAVKTTIGYTCTALAKDGQFTVPAYIFGALPAGTGTMGVQEGIYAPLVASGLDTGTAGGAIASFVDTTYQ